MADKNEEELHIIDLVRTEGYVIDDSDEGDPVLTTPDGKQVGTWRDGYPHEERMTRREYESIRGKLQIELLK